MRNQSDLSTPASELWYFLRFVKRALSYSLNSCDLSHVQDEYVKEWLASSIMINSLLRPRRHAQTSKFFEMATDYMSRQYG